MSDEQSAERTFGQRALEAFRDVTLNRLGNGTVIRVGSVRAGGAVVSGSLTDADSLTAALRELSASALDSPVTHGRLDVARSLSLTADSRVGGVDGSHRFESSVVGDVLETL